MKPAPIPLDEKDRLKSLDAYGVLDTLFEETFDELTRLASEICNTPIALVSLVAEDRQWFKSRHGLDAAETPRGLAFCGYTVLQDDLFIVPDASQDERFSDNPLVTHDPGIRFYAGAPIQGREGLRLGSLCVIDRVPRNLTDSQKSALRTLCRQVEAQLELRRLAKDFSEEKRKVMAQRDRLSDLQKKRAELMSFIAHDLQNPLASILPNARYLHEQPELSKDSQEVVADILSAAATMEGRVLNLLDVSNAEDGRVPLRAESVSALELLTGVARESSGRADARGQTVQVVDVPSGLALHADPMLLRRVVENLVANALKYAPANTQVTLEAQSMEDGSAELRVLDEGPGIPKDVREAVFQKHTRLERDLQRDRGVSRGLGLTFCKMAVEAHGGRIWVDDRRPTGSVFRVRLPLSASVGRGSGPT